MIRSAVSASPPNTTLPEARTSSGSRRLPVTRANWGARPTIDASVRRLTAIPGRPVSAFEAPEGCPFAPRCAHVQDTCRAARPPVEALDGGLVRCFRAAELLERRLAVARHG